MNQVISIFILLLSPLVSYAGGYPKTDAEFARLPAYCKARLHKAATPLQKKVWRKKIGKDFMHIHHYCVGLNLLNQSHQIGKKQAKRDALKAAIKQISYTQRHASEQFVLQPEMAYKIGGIYERLGDRSTAMKEYRKGIALNPRIPALYAALSDLFKAIGDDEEALNVLKRGLKHKPKSKKLNRRLKKLKNQT